MGPQGRLTRAQSKAMTKRANILIVAATSARRASLAELARGKGQGRAAMISTAPGFSLERLEQSGADILLGDIDGPSPASSMLSFLSEAPPLTGAIALIDQPDPYWVRQALNAGVNAILSRELDSEDLHLALDAVDAGLVLLHPSSARNLTATVPGLLEVEDQVEHLTAREREVLRLMSGGLGNKEIAARLGISEHTVKFHASSILGKMGAGSRTEAVSQGIRRGLITL